jgi:hypothetical protein
MSSPSQITFVRDVWEVCKNLEISESKEIFLQGYIKNIIALEDAVRELRNFRDFFQIRGIVSRPPLLSLLFLLHSLLLLSLLSSPLPPLPSLLSPSLPILLSSYPLALFSSPLHSLMPLVRSFPFLGISEIYSRYYESEESRNYFLQMSLPDLGDGMEGEERGIVE